MKLNRKYTVAWILWIFGFLALEYAAKKDKRLGDTLTEHVWATIGTKTKTKTALMWAARLGIAGLLVWLVPHLFTGAI